MIYSKSITLKYIFFILLIFLFCTVLWLPHASAATSPTAPKVVLNNRQLSFEVPPIIENDRTLVPLRAIFEAMGANVYWNPASRVVTASKGAITVTLPIYSITAKINGNVINLDTPAEIMNSRTLAPLRFVGEAFGGRVSWDENTRTVYINSSSADKPPAVNVNTYLVNLRNSPSTLAAVCDHAHSGEVLAVLAEQDGWFKISHGTQTAWVASWLVASSSNPDPNPAPQTPLVVLDAGHGGSDPGAVGNTLQEKNINLKITLMVGQLLKQNGITVIYTRSDDKYIGLEERSKIANGVNASLFVAIHNNANDSSSISGTETYFYAPSDNPDLFAQQNERERLAAAIQTALVNQIQRKDHGVKEANFSVLRNTMMPSALVEVAFISNSMEESLLQNDDFINRAVTGIANGILTYLKD